VLKYEVRQLRLEDKGMYYLPIPKLNAAQFRFIGADLRARGFSVALNERLMARMGDSRMVMSPEGLAWSSSELLDAVVPSVARVLDFPKAPSVANPYFVLKKSHGGFQIQFFPRLEGLGRWSSLRRQGECGLTPDEAVVLEGLLRDSEDEIACVTDYPTEGCSPMLFGRHQYYSSVVPAAEFLSNLRTISKRSSRNCYIPRTSVLKTKNGPTVVETSLWAELGQWCYLELAPQNL
jgi:hypothetical protein